MSVVGSDLNFKGFPAGFHDTSVSLKRTPHQQPGDQLKYHAMVGDALPVGGTVTPEANPGHGTLPASPARMMVWMALGP